MVLQERAGYGGQDDDGGLWESLLHAPQRRGGGDLCKKSAGDHRPSAQSPGKGDPIYLRWDGVQQPGPCGCGLGQPAAGEQDHLFGGGACGGERAGETSAGAGI